jgi:predicted ATPase
VQSRFDARKGAQLTQYVGRDAELAKLRARFDDAIRGQAQLVAISGEAGIGKSRLITAFSDGLAGLNFRTLLLQCSSYHTSSPWHPVIRRLEDAVGIRHDTSPAAKLEKLETWIGQFDVDADRMVPALAVLLDIPTDLPPSALTPQQQKKRIFEALVGLVQAQAAQQPIILVCEDAHWIDPTSREFLELLRKEAKNSSLLMVISFRPEFQWRPIDGSLDATLALSRLEPDQVACMVEAMAGGHHLPATVVEQIVTKTDGVPLFVEEMTKVVLEGRAANEGHVARGLRWVPAIPDTLHDSLMARLDQLAPMKVIAQISAVIGREFALDLLEAIAPYPEHEISAAIDRLLEAGLIFRRGDPVGERYTFKHALVQDAAYASMLRDDRRQLHIRIAEVLCSKFVDIAERAPELVAHHYTRAGEIRPAIEHWLKAGRQASTRTAFAEATTHFQTALQLLGELPESLARDELELQLQQSLASAFIAAKGFGAEETMLAFNRALQLCQKLEGSPQIFPVLNGMAGIHLMRGQFERSRGAAEELLMRARRVGDITAQLMGHRVLGMSLFMIGELGASRRELKDAIRLYDPPRHSPLALVFSHDFKATAQAYLGLASVLAGDIDGGLEDGREALAHAERMKHPHSVCYVLCFLTAAHLAAGMPLVAQPLAERTIALSGEYGFPQWLCAGHLLRGWACVEVGEAGSGLDDVRMSVRAMESNGSLVWVQFGNYQLARVLSKMGKTEEALALVDRLLAEIRRTTGCWFESEVHRLRGDLLQDTAAPVGDVEACYEAAIATALRQGARLWQLRATNALGSLWQAQGRCTTELHGRLAPLCADFAVSTANPDLEQGKALLTSLASSATH